MSWEAGGEHFRVIAPSLQGTVVRDLLNRYPFEAIPFVKHLVERQEGLFEEVLEDLAENPHLEAARLLESEYHRTDNKALRKRIKKLNHKRHSRGWPVCEPEDISSSRAVWSPPVPPQPVGALSISESPGSRMAWVIRNNVPKGMLVFCGLIYDQGGLMRFLLMDVTQGEAEKYRASLFDSEETLVAETDAGYCAHLIEEAYRQAPPRSPEEGNAFKKYRPFLRELIPSGPPPHPICELSANTDDVDAGPPTQEETATLLEHRLLAFWQIEPSWLRPYLEQYEEMLGSRIIVHPLQKKERIDGFFRETARAILSDPVRRDLWLRRVEDAAWVLHQTGAQKEAKLLGRIGRYLKDQQHGDGDIPFFAEMVRKTLEGEFKEKKTEEREQPSLIVKPHRQT